MLTAACDHLDVEVVTVHYRGAHGAAASRSGFCYRSADRAAANRRRRPFDPDYAQGFR